MNKPGKEQKRWRQDDQPENKQEFPEVFFCNDPKHTRMMSTKKAEPPPTRDVNRDSGTDSANGGWLRREPV